MVWAAGPGGHYQLVGSPDGIYIPVGNQEDIVFRDDGLFMYQKIVWTTMLAILRAQLQPFAAAAESTAKSSQRLIRQIINFSLRSKSSVELVSFKNVMKA